MNNQNYNTSVENHNSSNKNHSISQKLTSILALIFGIITLIASARILYFGSNPGYEVFIPLLIFNHMMGFIYIGAGYLIWKSKQKGKQAALIVFLINFLVLLIIGIVYLFNADVAIESLGAMSFRTAFWLLIVLSLKMTKK